jgi:hypothetical protein
MGSQIAVQQLGRGRGEGGAPSLPRVGPTLNLSLKLKGCKVLHLCNKVKTLKSCAPQRKNLLIMSAGLALRIFYGILSTGRAVARSKRGASLIQGQRAFQAANRSFRLTFARRNRSGRALNPQLHFLPIF